MMRYDDMLLTWGTQYPLGNNRFVTFSGDWATTLPQSRLCIIIDTIRPLLQYMCNQSLPHGSQVHIFYSELNTIFTVINTVGGRKITKGCLLPLYTRYISLQRSSGSEQTTFKCWWNKNIFIMAAIYSFYAAVFCKMCNLPKKYLCRDAYEGCLQIGREVVQLAHIRAGGLVQ